MNKKSIATPAAEETQKPTIEGPSVQVQDAWDHGYEIAKGLWDLLSVGLASDEGFTPAGLRVLEVAAQQLLNEMHVVDRFFNSENKGGEA